MTAYSAVEWGDEDSEPGLPEQIEAELALEREQALETELERDERPPEQEPEDEPEPERAMLKRELKRAALNRLENAARTSEDFKKVIVEWDKLASNEARRLREHEVSRGDVPLEHGKAMDGAIFPAYFMEPRQRQLMSGNFIDLIHDCPFELHELTADAALSGMLRRLRDDHKEIFYWHFIRQFSCAEVGRIRGQTDRNIRKTRAVIVRKLQKELRRALAARAKAGRGLSIRQRAFLEDKKNAALDGGGDG